MLDNIFSFIFGAIIFFFVGVIVGEETIKAGVTEAQVQYIEQGYTKAYTEQLGKDIGIPVSKCKLTGGEPVVNGKRVACLKEMTND